mgnify:CR=1 FL=1
MKSAIGNFDAFGNSVSSPTLKSVNDMDKRSIRYDLFSKRLVACEDIMKGDILYYEKEDGVTTMSPVETAALFTQNVLRSGIDGVAPSEDRVNVLDYVSKDEWDNFMGLAILMFANGATLYELQQRLMGLNE